jgi:hypothetical protein
MTETTELEDLRELAERRSSRHDPNFCGVRENSCPHGFNGGKP